MNRKFLKFEPDLDFVLIAVTASLKDYRACYLINKHLNLNFVRVDDLVIDNLNGSNSNGYFSLFTCCWEASETNFYFITNKGNEGHLIPEMRKVDFFLLIKNYIDEADLDHLVSGLNRIPEIVTALKIDPKKIKSRENLLF